jgi:hypothetical protein
VTRARLDGLQDKLWVLACAVQDVDGDLQVAAEVADFRAALDWLLDAARPLVATLEESPVPSQ